MAEKARAATCNRTETVGRRDYKRALCCFVLLSLLSACAPKAADLYQSAKALYREGRFSDAARRAEEGYASLRGQTQSPWYWKLGLLAAEAELLAGNTSRGETFLTARPPDPTLAPRFDMLRGYALSRRKRYTEARGLLTNALAGARSVHDLETQTDASLYLGTTQMYFGDLDAAAADFERARQWAEANHLPYQQSAALTDLGLIQIKRERYGDAIPLLESARRLADRAGARVISSFAAGNLANCYENLGNLDKALALLESRVEERKQFGLNTSLSNLYSELGVTHLRKGQTTEALRYFRQAFDAVNKDAPVQLTVAAENLARTLADSGSLDEAERFNRIAFQYANRDDKVKIASLTLTQAAIAERRGRHLEAIAGYREALNIGSAAPSVLWQAYAGLAAVYAAQDDFPNAQKNYAQALRVIVSNRADQLKTDYKIAFLSNLIRFYQDYVALLMEHGDSGRALEIADSSRAAVLTEDLLAQSNLSRGALLPQIQKAAQKTGAVFLFYWIAPRKSYLWAITGAGSQSFPLPEQQRIQQDIDSYRDAIEEQKIDPLVTPSYAGDRLYRELVLPAAGLTPPGSRVFIVPDGPLHNLNFETLIVPTPQRHYWIDDATVSIAPSLGILQAGKSAHSPRRSLLAIGDPRMDGTNYPPLPEAAAEIAAIRRQFPPEASTILTGPKAMVSAYAAAQPQNFSTIHFAAHVDANAESPLDSAIILSPHAGRFSLYARDVAQLPLTADLVTISACRGAGARALTGEGLVGFAWAFFQARARNVVTSLWDVYDSSTAELMNDFYSGVNGGGSYAASLRGAKRKMLASKYRSPYYWAPFQLYSRAIAP